MVTVTTILPQTPRRGRPPSGRAERVLLPVKVSPEDRTRFKVAAAEEGLTYGELITSMLDARDERRARQRRAQAHPLHQPRPASMYPGGGASAAVP